VLGYGNTVPVTLDEMLIHVKAVRRAVQRALLVADMPYGSFHTAGRGGTKRFASGKRRWGRSDKTGRRPQRVPLVRRLVDEEIAVMGHIGLTPQ